MAALAPLKSIVLNPTAAHTATVIFVHGLGDSGHGWKPVAQQFIRQDTAASAHIKWILPHAPEKSVTANGGAIMPSWFDILSFGFSGAEDQKGMLETVSKLNKIITEEVDAGIDPSRIVLGGFSQGGAMSLLTGLTTERKLGGVVVVSGWLPLRDTVKSMTSEHAKNTKMFWGHGQEDPLVTLPLGTKSVDFLRKEIGMPEPSAPGSATGLEFKTYPNVGHSTSMQELADIWAFIKKILPASS